MPFDVTEWAYRNTMGREDGLIRILKVALGDTVIALVDETVLCRAADELRSHHGGCHPPGWDAGAHSRGDRKLLEVAQK
jgi:hypothetical protein